MPHLPDAKRIEIELDIQNCDIKKVKAKLHAGILRIII